MHTTINSTLIKCNENLPFGVYLVMNIFVKQSIKLPPETLTFNFCFVHLNYYTLTLLRIMYT